MTAPHEPRPALELSDVRKSYGRDRRRPVLDVEHLRFDEGERILVEGRNGSGKSTLLRILAGASVPDTGRVVRGPGLVGAPVGYVPQSTGLYTDMTVRRNLGLRRALYGRPPRDPEATWYVDDLALTPVLERRVGELSGGIQRLTAFAAALHVDPDWLLLDEPFEGLDDDRREAVLDVLRRLAERVRLIVVATPSPADYPDATRVVRLVDGRPA